MPSLAKLPQTTQEQFERAMVLLKQLSTRNLKVMFRQALLSTHPDKEGGDRSVFEIIRTIQGLITPFLDSNKRPLFDDVTNFEQFLKQLPSDISTILVKKIKEENPQVANMNIELPETPKQETQHQETQRQEAQRQETQPKATKQPTAEETQPKATKQPTAEETKPKATKQPTAEEIQLKTTEQPAIEETQPKATEQPAIEETQPKATEQPAIEETQPKATEQPAIEETQPKATEQPAEEETQPKATEQPAIEETQPKATEQPAAEETQPKATEQPAAEEQVAKEAQQKHKKVHWAPELEQKQVYDPKEEQRQNRAVHKVTNKYKYGDDVNRGRFHLFKAHFKDFKGDYLKNKILEEIKKRIEETSSKKDLDDLKKEIRNSDEYKVLAKGQGLVTRIAQKINESRMKTSSIKALESMFAEQEKNLENKPKHK